MKQLRIKKHEIIRYQMWESSHGDLSKYVKMKLSKAGFDLDKIIGWNHDFETGDLIYIQHDGEGPSC